MTNKLEVLENSLKKKEKKLNERFKSYFDDVKSANGQPLNDKRNGYATMRRWDKKEDAIRNQKAEIEKTKNAIHKEKWKIDAVNYANEEENPKEILKLVDEGILTQWRRFPNRFFVNGVDRGRIIWDVKKQKLLCAYISEIPDEQYAKFRDVFRKLKEDIENR
jgi:hypothetical protein